MPEKETDPVPTAPKNQSSRRSSIVDLTSATVAFQSGSSEREREKINLAFPPLTRTARSHGLLSRPSITSFPIPHPSGHTTRPAYPSLATAYPRTRGFTRFERVQPGRLLGSVPYKLHGRRFASCVYLFFSPLSSYFSALLVREDTRRTTTITTMTDDEDDDDNNNNDRPGSEAWPVAEIP